MMTHSTAPLRVVAKVWTMVGRLMLTIEVSSVVMKVPTATTASRSQRFGWPRTAPAAVPGVSAACLAKVRAASTESRCLCPAPGNCTPVWAVRCSGALWSGEPLMSCLPAGGLPSCDLLRPVSAQPCVCLPSRGSDESSHPGDGTVEEPLDDRTAKVFYRPGLFHG